MRFFWSVYIYIYTHTRLLMIVLLQASTTFETLVLAYQSLGVVYGDIGTSPLYVFSSISLENPTERDILGILSLIFWTLTLIGLVKYVCIVLHADDHGEGTLSTYTNN